MDKSAAIPSAAEFERTMTERHTRPVYEKLKSASAAVAGLGGLGSNIAVSLARAGIGKLLLVDHDKVELSNLNRQQYDTLDLGMYKTDALRRSLKRINPYLEIETETVLVTEENAAALFGDFKIVCEAFDRADQKAMLINALLEQCPDTIIVSGSGMAGMLSANSIVTRNVFDRLYISGDGITDIKDANGLMAPRVAVCANHQANMVLRLILGETEP